VTLNIPTGYYEVAMHHHLTASLHDSVCTMGVRYTGADFSTDASKWIDGWGDLWKAAQASWIFDRTVFQAQGGTVLEVVNVGGLPGLDSDAVATSNIAFLLNKITALPGRRGKGRCYMPGVGEAAVNGQGYVSSTKLAALQTALNNATVKWAAGHWSLVLLHNVPTGDSPALYPPTPLTAIGFGAQVATQRNRMPRA
jgi:hypothetical protein